MGRRKNRLPTSYDLFIIGEQLRKQLTSAGFIKDHRHHLRKHRKCFVAKDAIDWLVRMHHVDSRDEALGAMNILLEFNVLHHVTDDQEFKDKAAYFRFTKDDDTYLTDRELTTFYRGLDIYDKLKQTGKSKVLREFYHKGELHTEAFYGSDLVDFLQHSENVVDRQTVVDKLKDLQGRGLIVHMTEDCMFVDDRLIYEFGVNFHKPCLLNEVLEIMDRFSTFKVNTKLVMDLPDQIIEAEEEATDDPEEEEEEDEDEDVKMTAVGENNNKAWGKANHVPSQDKDVSERIIKVHCDDVGYGLVLRGCAPSFVHCVAPLGPASKARVKVGMAITSVNGQPAYHMRHSQVGQLIAQSQSQGPDAVLSLGVTSYRKHRTSYS